MAHHRKSDYQKRGAKNAREQHRRPFVPTVYECGLSEPFCHVFIRQPLASAASCDFHEPSSVAKLILALIVPECLFVQGNGKMVRFDERVRSLQRPLQQAPKVLQSVRMDMADL